VDKFLGYCCEPNANLDIKLKYYIYPIVKMHNISKNSDINTGETFVWDMSTEELIDIYSSGK
jgi:hypothetical protein